MNPALQSIIAQFSVEAQALLDLLEGSRITPKIWRDRMAMLLARYHTAALMAGVGSTAIPDGGILILADTVGSQLGYLNRFYTEVAAAEAFKATWRVRADMYANSAGASYWDGYIYSKAGKFLPVPATPRDGSSQCLNSCLCNLRVVPLGGEDFDVYWELGKADHCQTCVERAAQWSPLKIRDGVLKEWSEYQETAVSTEATEEIR